MSCRLGSAPSLLGCAETESSKDSSFSFHRINSVILFPFHYHSINQAIWQLLAIMYWRPSQRLRIPAILPHSQAWAPPRCTSSKSRWSSKPKRQTAFYSTMRTRTSMDGHLPRHLLLPHLLPPPPSPPPPPHLPKGPTSSR